MILCTLAELNCNILILGRCELINISTISGASISIDKSSQKNHHIRKFVIEGSKDQITNAKQMMTEKAEEFKLVCIYYFIYLLKCLHFF